MAFICNVGDKTSRSSSGKWLLLPKAGRESTEDWPRAAETIGTRCSFEKWEQKAACYILYCVDNITLTI